jgi:thioredoxin-related protein
MLMRSTLLALLMVFVCVPARAASPAHGVATARDLQHAGQVARHKGIPVLIIFTSPDCRYCDRVISYYLVPMQSNPGTAGTVLIRQLDMSSSKPLVDFSGHATTAHAFAKALKVTFAPTIMLFTPDGKPAADPLVGLGPEDYYGGYLDQRVASAREKMHSAAGTGGAGH